MCCKNNENGQINAYALCISFFLHQLVEWNQLELIKQTNLSC